MFKVVKYTEHPVVSMYMDIILTACQKICKDSHYIVFKQRQSKKDDYIVTDSPLLSIYYILRGYRHNITWFQGVAPEESYMKNKSHLRYLILSLIERIVLERADRVFFVSSSMRNHYERKYKKCFAKKAIIMPCFNETKVISENIDYAGKYENNNFVYLGGLQEWQCFEETVQIYAEIENRSGDKTKLYVYTKQKDQALSVLKLYDVKNYNVDYVAPDLLSDKLRNIKYGFVLREDMIINRVATPTKFSNYLANGIIPIYSSCLNSFYEYDKKNQFGIICDLENKDNGINDILINMDNHIQIDEVRKKCQNAFTDYYSAERYIEKISSKLKQLDE